MEEVQSAILARWVGILRRTTCICKFWNSQPTKIPLRTIKLEVSIFETIQNLKLDDWRLMKKCSRQLWKNLVLIQRASSIYIIFGNLRLSNFQRKDGKRKDGYIINFYKNKIVDWHLDGRNPDSYFEGNRVWISRRIRPKNFCLVWPIKFLLQGIKCIVWQSCNFLQVYKCRLIPRWTKCSQQFWRTKGLNLRKIRKLLYFRAFSVHKLFDVRKVSQNIVLQWCSTIAKLLIETSIRKI